MSDARSTKVLILTLGNGLNVLINFLTLPYLVRTLSYEEYGSFGQVLLLITVIQGIFAFNLNQIANIYFSEKEYSQQDVFKTLKQIIFYLSIGGTLVMFLTAPLVSWAFDNPLLQDLIFLSLVNLLAQIPVSVFISVLVYFGRVKSVTSILVLSNLLRIALMLIAIQMFHSVHLLMICLSLTSLVQAFAFYYSIPDTLRKGGRYIKSLAAKFFRLASPLAVSSIIERSLFYIDGMMISAILGTTAFAFYRAGAIEVPFVASLYGSVATIVMPEVARLYADRNLSEIVRLKRIGISTTAFLIYPILVYLLFFSGPLVAAYLSDKYLQSVLVFSIFNLSLLIRVNDYQDVIIVSGNGKFIFGVVVVMCVFNLILNYFLISYFGILGGAFSFILCLFGYAAVLIWKSVKILKCSIGDMVDVAFLLKMLLISTVFASALYGVYMYMLHELIFVLVAAPVYMILILLVAVKLKITDSRIVELVEGRFFKLMGRSK